ncbi:hypothetical protein D5301_05585 [Stenotrophomonas sp. MH181796]|uniref:hypothetical protein n=1 Tax=Stenotrophomonas sp. MH181796 TaxID=2339228 RepID=UPI00129CE7C2|nr:hypothetical protein [Stenotrophomonas sp. MH181796]MRI41714.1 hypothetical protein [Stenotrophomonas sp. MH181796]
MDFSSIATAIASLKSAQELAAATLAVRDFNQSAVAIAQINEKLLAAQQGLLAHNIMLLQLQNEHFEATKELRELKEALSQKAGYELFDLGGGVIVYRANLAPQQAGTDSPGRTQPDHYLCQPCYDAGTKVVLQPGADGYMRCPVCRQTYRTANSRSRLTWGSEFNG